jgi:hypothetical protein
VELNKMIVDFMEKAREDPYIGPSHISVFMALIFECNLQGGFENMKVSRREVMCRAKISSIVTYFKCMKDLDQFSYLQYSPSTSGLTGSRITINANL